MSAIDNAIQRQTDHLLLQRDIEGHEREVFAGDPMFLVFAGELAACGFELHDFAALATDDPWA